jgi:hypothetical protein
MTTFKGFPLYSTLVKELDDVPVNLLQKQAIMNNIKKINTQGYEYIYGLIISYYIDQNKKNAETIPYEGKQLKTGVKFNLEDLPDKLQKLIYLFIEKHIKTH